MAGHLRNTFRFAMLGFAMTGFFVAYQLLTDSAVDVPREPAVMIFFVILCPPSLLSVAVDPEVGSRAFYFCWTAIGILNAGLYTTIVALINRRKKSTDSTDKLPS
jgi:hypothetical protein